MNPPPIIDSLDALPRRYRALFCDVWGCLHDGVRIFPAAAEALIRYRKAGGHVVLITNAPRPHSVTARQLRAMRAPEGLYDAIVTSGDAAQAGLAAGVVGSRVYHLGPERDEEFFRDLPAEIANPVPIERVPLKEAEGIVCTGLFDDETETPEDYRAIILEGVNRRLPMLCVNPDIVVDRGERRIYCAGAIAQAYAEAGGVVHYFGKPHPPIYDLARRRLALRVGEEIDDEDILCIGDGIATDIAGAVAEGLDSLFVTGGIAAEETGGDPPDPERLAAFLARHQLSVTAAIGALR
ncbi:MAG: TIGR01459 family HAD-type hydrolase [Alphaproteobacteria bacterium]|nr:MAG: TIGR01459 family HAD-type hydrolase [Alphaproteobacteria bacterium]